ncbi:DUF3575 domain-containing protein [Flavobacterium psychrophilum]|nr:DUF3575 domain-containing protein [Flavobacterium psychrophilum]
MTKLSKKTLYYLSFMVFCYANTWSQTNIKANITTLVGMPQIAIETKVGNKLTFQLDVMCSLWKSINNGPQEFIIVTPELRYHFSTLEKGFYIGAHIAGSKYKMQKWNYINTDLYQTGYSLLYGATVGFKVPIDNHFALDLFVGGGNQQGYYKGYNISTGERYENATKYNKSGEWLPYRGGVMIVYKI